jgi:hypothetical protein
MVPVILGIPGTDLQLADFNEPIFAGAQNINIIKNIKIIVQLKPNPVKNKLLN